MSRLISPSSFHCFGALAVIVAATTLWAAVAAAIGMASFPAENSFVANAGVSVLLGVVAVWMATLFRRARRRSVSETETIKVVSEDGLESENADEEELGVFDPQMIQQWTRSNDNAGSERIEAVLRADFAPRQQVATLHLPFCPSFAVVPRVVAVSLDAATSVQVGRVLPNGVRIDVKRSSTAAFAAMSSDSHWVSVNVAVDVRDESQSC